MQLGAEAYYHGMIDAPNYMTSDLEETAKKSDGWTLIQ